VNKLSKEMKKKELKMKRRLLKILSKKENKVKKMLETKNAKNVVLKY